MFKQLANTKASMRALRIGTIIVLATLGTLASRPAQADDQQPTEPAVRAIVQQLDPTKTVFVEYSGLKTSAGKCWISVAEVSDGADDHEYWDWTSGSDGLMAFRPLKPGKYEIRLFCNWPNDG